MPRRQLKTTLRQLRAIRNKRTRKLVVIGTIQNIASDRPSPIKQRFVTDDSNTADEVFLGKARDQRTIVLCVKRCAPFYPLSERIHGTPITFQITTAGKDQS